MTINIQSLPKDIWETLMSSCAGKLDSMQELIDGNVAAVLYGIGVQLDDDPSLFFALRDVKIEDLISETISKKAQTLLGKSNRKSRRVIEDADISGMFGIEMVNDVKNK